ncbi:DUF3050 domain-containing protein [Candidatus Albibeggiatoa sp. nov. NOAA]|uniref:DUF3050 domain-containing protein n=1 Tax=Candidatus Albibeggiatoa sp. nov. NOAA TaxID=3162724 RepID=UPI0032FB359C|nr:DUF3050 domain-containing protein [Thiotrichaceae bacterium]
MSVQFNAEVIQPLQQQLDNHPVYAALQTMDDLRCFMNHHIYSVWDFMSMIKYLQQKVAPTTYPWTPQGDGNVRRFINELVMEEESDQANPIVDGQHSSHFELYCRAMREVGADAETAWQFVDLVKTQGIDTALNANFVPAPSRQFTQTTFAFIASDKPHCVAAALALGREKIIPVMFRAFLDRMQVTPEQAPIFHFYLNRHIHLDQDFHAPLSIRLLQELCENNPDKMQEAEQAACQAIEARIMFWDGVMSALK